MTEIRLDSLARGFIGFADNFERLIARGCNQVGKKVRRDATEKIGHYQPSVGPFPAWQNLSAYTLKIKQKAGAVSDDPLIGHYPENKKNKVWNAHLRTTIEWEMQGWAAVHIGTADPLGEYHEYGVPEHNLPPRPFLRPAAFENEEFFQNEMAVAYQKAIDSIL